MKRKIAFIGLLLSALSAGAQDLRIERIDPPNWWSGMKWDTVQLLVYGQGLSGVKARFEPADPVVLSTEPGLTPDYCFVTVHIGPGCAAGEYRLLLGSLRDEAAFPFPVLERSTDDNRHRGFGPDDVVYLIMPDRFADGNPGNNTISNSKLFLEYDRQRAGAWHGGDLQGVIDHLPYLDELGVSTLWLTPVLENAGQGSYHGYAATDYYQIDPRFGTNTLYAELVESAHALGMKIIFDHVNNHCGVDHVWVKKPPTAGWFNGSLEKHLLDGHNLQGVHDPYVAPGELEKMRSFWFVDRMPDLNQRDPHVATYLIQQTLWWIEFSGLDGIREDTYPYAYPEFGVEWVRAILREYPSFNITGECWGTSAFTAMFQKDARLPRTFSSELPNVIDFGFMMAMERYLKGQESLLAVYQRLSEDYFFGDPSNVLTLLGNHDTPRPLFISGENRDRVKVALHILLTTRGIPQLFYGDEIGIVGGESHVALRQDFPGGFPGDERSAFLAAERTASEKDMYNYTRQLLSLRAEHPALRRGTLRQLRPDWDGGYYAFARYHNDEHLISIANGNDKAAGISFSYLKPLLGTPDKPGAEKAVRLKDLRSGTVVELAPGGSLSLEAYGTRLYEVLR